MEIGDRVVVVELDDEDKRYTDLKIGDKGIIVGLSNICNVHFDRDIKHDSRNWNYETKSYDMFTWQVEVIKLEKEELEKYREIGTVEECREAVEKQKHKRPIDITKSEGGVLYGNCPSCGRKKNYIMSYKMCTECGQKLDWGTR